jgi:hypothetical protein
MTEAKILAVMASCFFLSAFALMLSDKEGRKELKRLFKR